jgi:hypothetical protein
VSLYSDATTRGFGGYTLPELTDIPALMNLATDASLRRDEKSLEPAFASLSASMAGRAAQVWPTPQSRLAFGCAIVHEVHVACMQTLLSPSWTPRDGTTLLWVQLPGSHERFRLPIMSYDENITASYYNPWIKACMGKYEYILNDERQDNSMVKLAFLYKMLLNSDTHGGHGHVTGIIAFGDDDQSVNGWNGALPDVDAKFVDFIRRREAQLSPALRQPPRPEHEPPYDTINLVVSKRCPVKVIEFANGVYAAAWKTYARDALYARTERPWMTPAEGAIDGTVEYDNDVTFAKFPIAAELACAPGADVLIISRTSTSLLALYPMLKKRGVACFLDTPSQRECPLVSVIGAIRRLASVAASADNGVPGATAMLAMLPPQGAHGIDDITAQCLLVTINDCINELAVHGIDAEDVDHTSVEKFCRARFNEPACKRVTLITAHSVKGREAYTTYILQPNNFPLERALSDGPVALSQEPRVHYVALTRATHHMYLLKHSSGNDDNDLETVLFAL